MNDTAFAVCYEFCFVKNKKQTGRQNLFRINGGFWVADIPEADSVRVDTGHLARLFAYEPHFEHSPVIVH